MKIVHMSDSHLGFHKYNKVDDNDSNLIEERIYSSFNQTINKIIELKPDVVVHAGDVFHHTRPGVRSLYVFKQGLEKISNAGIPAIIISGNHDTPRTRATISPFIIYEGIKDIHIAYKKYERFDVGDWAFHCIPYCADPNDNESEFSKINLSGRDVLIMHGMLKSFWDHRLDTVGEYELDDDSFLKSYFDYIALGHLHGQHRVNGNTWYSGSVEYFNFNDSQQEKGILFVDLERREFEQIRICQEKYWIDCPPIDCREFNSEDMIAAISGQCHQNGLKDKILKINLTNVNRDVYRGIYTGVNHAKLRELKSLALSLEITPTYDEEKKNDMKINRDNLQEEFAKFIQQQIINISASTAVREKAIAYGADVMKEVISARNTEDLNVSE